MFLSFIILLLLAGMLSTSTTAFFITNYQENDHPSWGGAGDQPGPVSSVTYVDCNYRFKLTG